MTIKKPDRSLEKALHHTEAQRKAALRRMINALRQGKSQHFQGCERDYDRLDKKSRRLRRAWLEARVAYETATREARRAKQPPRAPQTFNEAMIMQRAAWGVCPVIQRSPVALIRTF